MIKLRSSRSVVVHLSFKVYEHSDQTSLQSFNCRSVVVQLSFTGPARVLARPVMAKVTVKLLAKFGQSDSKGMADMTRSVSVNCAASARSTRFKDGQGFCAPTNTKTLNTGCASAAATSG